MGRPVSATIKLNDALEVKFDFEDAAGGDDAEAPDFSAQASLGDCPKCGARVFEHGQSYVCEKATGPDRSCDFRSGRLILQRPIEPLQMRKLLSSGKTDLLQFVSARTRRPFSAFLVRQPDGKIGFEFEARKDGKAGRGARGAAAALRLLGKHPDDGAPVELYAGRYGPYVKHGSINATLPDRERVDTLTLDEALPLLADKLEKSGGAPTAKRRTAKPKTAKAPSTRSATARKIAEAPPPAPVTRVRKTAVTKKSAAKTTTAKKPVARKTASGNLATVARTTRK
jgi:DNA topoisomerase-3